MPIEEKDLKVLIRCWREDAARNLKGKTPKVGRARGYLAAALDLELLIDPPPTSPTDQVVVQVNVEGEIYPLRLTRSALFHNIMRSAMEAADSAATQLDDWTLATADGQVIFPGTPIGQGPLAGLLAGQVLKMTRRKKD